MNSLLKDELLKKTKKRDLEYEEYMKNKKPLRLVSLGDDDDTAQNRLRIVVMSDTHTLHNGMLQCRFFLLLCSQQRRNSHWCIVRSAGRCFCPLWRLCKSLQRWQSPERFQSMARNAATQAQDCDCGQSSESSEAVADREAHNRHKTQEYLFNKLSRQEIQDQIMTNCVYLQDSAVTIRGVKFYGSPWNTSR